MCCARVTLRWLRRKPNSGRCSRWLSARLGLGEMASLFWHCVAHRPETLTREAVGEAVVAQGVAAVTPALRTLLGQILQGR